MTLGREPWSGTTLFRKVVEVAAERKDASSEPVMGGAENIVPAPGVSEIAEKYRFARWGGLPP